jgi:hypothetical protein
MRVEPLYRVRFSYSEGWGADLAGPDSSLSGVSSIVWGILAPPAGLWLGRDAREGGQQLVLTAVLAAQVGNHVA